MDNNILYSQRTASNIEQYLRENKLYYGPSPRENGDASWYLALNNYYITSTQKKILSKDLPNLINTFHTTCFQIIRHILINKDTHLEKLRKYITAGVSEEMLCLWKNAITSSSEVFSSRPDLVSDTRGNFHIVEYNTDGGADKGNTLGVNQYSQLFLKKSLLGEDLASLFIQAIKKVYSKDTLTVATVLPNGYRKEYDAQNHYFARYASIIGKKYGIHWISVPISDIKIIFDNISASYKGKDIIVDIIDREFKMPGFTTQGNFSQEKRLIMFLSLRKDQLLGSILPFQDKIFLSTLFNKNYSSFYDKQILEQLRSVHAETAVLDAEEKVLDFGTENIRIDTIYQQQHPWDFVLKKGGDTEETTGSKGVFISTDLSKKEWQQAMDIALADSVHCKNYWVLQRFYQPNKQITRFIKNSRSQPKELAVIHRIAPYYVKQGKKFVLGNILVTAGTDEETYKKSKKNIHGLRQNTYQAVEVL